MILLQWIGGLGYLLNKIFFSWAERAEKRQSPDQSRRWRIFAWVTYLIGLPPWVIIFAQKGNWIAASVEASGAPAMILGLIAAIRSNNTKPPVWLDRLAQLAIAVGFSYSLWVNRGLSTLSQWLEIGLVLGFLVGTYLTAKKQRQGYLWLVLMHVSCGTLMYLHGFMMLLAQQIISLIFIADAYWQSRTSPPC